MFLLILFNLSSVSGCRCLFHLPGQLQNSKPWSVGGSSNFKRELAAIHPSGRRWGPHAAAIPHLVLPSGSATCKGFGPSPEKSSFGNQHDPDFKIVGGFLKINLQIILYGWPSDTDLIFRAPHMLSLCCVPGESNLASLV